MPLALLCTDVSTLSRAVVLAFRYSFVDFGEADPIFICWTLEGIRICDTNPVIINAGYEAGESARRERKEGIISDNWRQKCWSSYELKSLVALSV